MLASSRRPALGLREANMALFIDAVWSFHCGHMMAGVTPHVLLRVRHFEQLLLTNVVARTRGFDSPGASARRPQDGVLLAQGVPCRLLPLRDGRIQHGVSVEPAEPQAELAVSADAQPQPYFHLTRLSTAKHGDGDHKL